MITLRNSEGEKIYRDFFVLDRYVYQFNVGDMVAALDLCTEFIGSFEVELFSNHDLKFPFPAIEVFYETPDGISFVHSNQRVFNNIEDMDRSSALNPWQTGFDIYLNDKWSGYLTIISGPREAKDSKARLTVCNFQGEVMDELLELGDLAPYATRFICLKDVPSVQAFLGGDVGFCKVDFDTVGVFNRIACGNVSNDGARFVVTHSYYDCSGHSDYYDKAEMNRDEYSCFLPFNMVNGLDLDLVFYPIYARSELFFSLDCLSPDGRVRTRIEKFASLGSPGTEMVRVDVRRLLQEHGVSSEPGLYCLHIDPAEESIPARLPFGMNYRKGDLGCNINSSVLVSPGYGLRNRAYLWGPLFWREGEDNWILLSHFSKVKGSFEEADVCLKIFGGNGVIFSNTYRTSNGTALNINADVLISESGYKPSNNEVLWYTLESTCPNYVSTEIHIS